MTLGGGGGGALVSETWEETVGGPAQWGDEPQGVCVSEYYWEKIWTALEGSRRLRLPDFNTIGT